MNVNPEDPFAGIVECAAHAREMDEDCSYCEAEFSAKNEVSGILSKKVEDGFKDLIREGVQPPGGLIASIRLELLIDSILTSRNRLHFEVECTRRLLHSVNETKKDLLRQKITGGKGQGLHVIKR